MKIRYAQEDDLPALLRLGEAMLQESRFAHYGLKQQKVLDLCRWMLRETRSAVILVAERSDGEVVGMLAGHLETFYFAEASLAQDKAFYVTPAARGSSAAIKLLLAFRRWAESRQVAEISINMSVAVNMPRFNRMMQRAGFTCCGANFYQSLPGRPSA